MTVILVLGLLSGAGARAQGAELVMLAGRGTITHVAWYPDGERLLVTTPYGATVYARDLTELHHFPALALAALSPDGVWVAGFDQSGVAGLWDAQTYAFAMPLPSSGVVKPFALAWSPDGRYLATSGDNAELVTSIWDVEANFESAAFLRNAGQHLIWNPAGSRLAIMGEDATHFVVYTLKPETALMGFDGGGEFNHLFWHNDDEFTQIYPVDTVYAGARWDARTGQQRDTSTYNTNRGTYSPTRDAFAVPSHSGAYVYDQPSGNLRFQLDLDLGDTSAWVATYSRDGAYLALGTNSWDERTASEILIVGAQTGQVFARLTLGRQGIEQVAWSPDDRHLLVADAAGQLIMVHVARREVIATSTAHTTVGHVAAWGSDGTRLAIADLLGGGTVWGIDDAAPLATFSGHPSALRTLKWQPGGDLIAANANPDRFGSYQDSNLAIIDTANPQRHLFVPARDHFVFDWSPDGAQIASMSGTGYDNLALWAPDDAGSLVTFDFGSASNSEGLAWSPSGRYIAALSMGYGGHPTYMYDLVDNGTRSAWGSLLGGDITWSPTDALMWLSWGAGSHGPPGLYTPSTSRTPPSTFLEGGLFVEQMPLRGMTQIAVNGRLSPHGTYALALDAEGAGLVWRTDDETPLFALAEVASASYTAWSDDERRLAAVRRDGSIVVLDAAGRVLAILPTLAGLNKADGALFWSPDGQHVAHLARGIARVWRIA